MEGKIEILKAKNKNDQKQIRELQRLLERQQNEIVELKETLIDYYQLQEEIDFKKELKTKQEIFYYKDILLIPNNFLIDNM